MYTVTQGHSLRALGGSTVAAASLDAAGPVVGAGLTVGSPVVNMVKCKANQVNRALNND